MSFYNLFYEQEMTSNDCEVLFLLYLNCPETVMEQRLLERGKTSGRNDDNIVSIKQRFKTYLNDTMPVIELFRPNGKLREVDTNRDMEAIYSDIKVHFQNASFS